MKKTIGPSIWAATYPMIGTKKRMEAENIFWYNQHKCKVTYVGAKEYYYIHLDTRRDGVLPFSLFESEFRLSKNHGYYKGLHPFFVLKNEALDQKLNK